MKIESISNPEAWAQFLKLADAARARNSGLTMQIQGTQPVRNNNTLSGISPAGFIKQVNNTQLVQQPKQTGKVSGTLFDAYA